MNLEAIRAQIEALLGEQRTMHTTAGESALGDEQQTRWEAIDTELVELRTNETAAVEVEARAARVAESRSRFGAQFMQKVEPTADVTDVRGLSRMQARDKALAAMEVKDNVRHLKPDQLDKLDGLLRTQNDDTSGEQIARRLLVTESADYRSAWQKLVTQTVPILTPEEGRAINEFRNMAGGVDASGGFGVPVLIDPTIILTAQGSLNPFRKIARQETITTDEWKGVSSAGVTWSHDAEAAAVSDDSPTLAQPSVVVHEARGFIPYSIRVGQDYPGFAQEMAKLLMEGYDELQAQMLAVGSGALQPFGIITALDANTNVEVVVTTDGAFGGVDINKVWGALPDRYKTNATWVMNHDVGNEVASFGNGNNLSFVTVDLTGVLEKIRNRPVEFSSYFPDFIGTTGAANILTVGDFRNYLIADRAGMSVELVPHLFDITNNRPTGERGWFAWARYGADSINDLGFRLLQNQ